MAAYRARGTIVETVRSVLAQSFTDWELLIAADDGSDYGDFLRRNGIDDGRIRGLSTGALGAGPARARNAALAAAGGRFVAPLDADDAWLPERLAVLVPLASRYGMACDNPNAVREDGVRIANPFPVSERTWRLAVADVIRAPAPLFPVLRREIAGAGYREEIGLGEDVVFNIECLYRNGGMVITGRGLADYVQRPHSLCNGAGAWRRAEAAYARILEMLAAGAIDLPGGGAEAIALFEAKRRLNREYAAAREGGEVMSFQEFATRRR